MDEQLSLFPTPERRARRREDPPRPFLKWAGGKGQLLPDLLQQIEAAGSFRRYHEPFLGGGALFFALYRGGQLARLKPRLSDGNANLIVTYQAVRDNVLGVITRLGRHARSHGEEHYYAVRAETPSDPAAAAARIIYLNRTCFNGLYRENSRGEFNVPFGRYVNPVICDEENLRAVSQALQNVCLETADFESVLEHAKPGDFVYFDPPYDPLSKSSSFTAYAKGGFGEAEQRRLAGVFAELAGRGVKALLSNSATPLIEDLYRGFHIERVKATRAVNSKANGRGAIDEFLVRSY
jgi:DNA adenine methylase